MNKLFRVIDRKNGRIFHLGNKAALRMFIIENHDNDEIEVHELEWNYKREMLQIMNGSAVLGLMNGMDRAKKIAERYTRKDK
jgi:hypothetical protein